MTNSELAAAAWNAVRRADDAPWEKLSLLLKGKLTALAEKYVGNARVDEGDYPPEGFAEKVFELAAGADIAVGDPIVFLESGPQTSGPIGVEHENTHIPSPIPEDVDPLKGDLASAPIEIGSDSPKETPSEPTPVKKRKSAKKKTTKKAAKKSKK